MEQNQEGKKKNDVSYTDDNLNIGSLLTFLFEKRNEMLRWTLQLLESMTAPYVSDDIERNFLHTVPSTFHWSCTRTISRNLKCKTQWRVSNHYGSKLYDCRIKNHEGYLTVTSYFRNNCVCKLEFFEYTSGWCQKQIWNYWSIYVWVKIILRSCF